MLRFGGMENNVITHTDKNQTGIKQGRLIQT